MTRRRAGICAVGVGVLCAWCAVSSAGTLEVGPGKTYQRIEDANARAKPGDLILVYPLAGGAAYEGVAIYVSQRNVTFRGVGAKPGERVALSGTGFDYSGVGRTPRAIFQFNRSTDGCVLENFELSHAHNGSHNGAGVRINQANDVTVRNCDIHNNGMGVMSNGDGSLAYAVNQRFENCLIHHNGDPAEPGYNHNLYLGGASATLFACEVHSSLTGHNVKSRAHYNRIEYCYIHHSANREFDLVDAGETSFPNSDAVLVGSVIVKDPACPGNRAVIHFGQDGGKPRDGTIFLIHNTVVTPFRSPVVDLSSARAGARFFNNLFDDGGKNQKGQVLVDATRGGAGLLNVSGSHNWFSGGFANFPPGFSPKDNVVAIGVRPLFLNQAKGDYRLVRREKFIFDAGLAWDKIDLADPLAKPSGKRPFSVPWQYKHPAGTEPRVDKGAPDLGAYAFDGR